MCTCEELPMSLIFGLVHSTLTIKRELGSRDLWDQIQQGLAISPFLSCTHLLHCEHQGVPLILHLIS
jgi:hypothetical protein